MNKQLLFIYSFLFSPQTKAQKKKRNIYIFAVIPFLIAVLVGAVLFNVFYTFSGLGPAVYFIPSLLIPLFLFVGFGIRTWIELDRKHVSMRLASGMSRAEYIKGNLYTTVFFVFFIDLVLVLMQVKVDSSSVMVVFGILALIVGINILILSLTTYIFLKTKNVYIVVLVLFLAILAWGFSFFVPTTGILLIDDSTAIIFYWMFAGFIATAFLITQFISSRQSLIAWSFDTGNKRNLVLQTFENLVASTLIYLQKFF